MLTGRNQQRSLKILKLYEISAKQCAPVVEALKANRDAWVRFMMRFELGLERPEHGRAIQSATTIACAYIVGGLFPFAPYFMVSTVSTALSYSIMLTLLALAGFGFFKGTFTGASRVRSAAQTLLVGSIAAASA